MAVPITLGADTETTKAGVPVPLFFARVGSALQGSARQQYMTAPDGERFLVNTVVEEAPSPLTIILNWTGAPAP
jgi:hypothetical protein